MDFSLTTENLLKLKFYNDKFWVIYSEYSLPVIIIIWIYKFFKPLNWRKLKNYSDLPNLMQDKIVRVFIFYAPVYYLIDAILISVTGLIFSYNCKMYLLWHHIISFTFLPLVVISKYLPWW